MSQDRNLHGAIKEVFAVVYAVCFIAKGPGEVSQTFIERATGLSRQTVVDSLKSLLTMGYIEHVANGKRGICIYMVTKHFPPPSSQEDRLVKETDQSKDLTSQENRLVEGIDQSEKLTTYRSNNLTSTSQNTRHNIKRKNKDIIGKPNKKNSHLFLDIEYKEKSTI